MDLTDGAFLVVLGIIAIALLGMLVAGVPGGRSAWTAGIARGVEAVTFSLVVVLFAGAALNDQYLFYVSWSDLFTGSATSTSAQAGANVRAALAANVRGPGFSRMSAPTAYPPLPDPGGQLQTYVVTGARSHVRGQVLVYLPAGYQPSAARRYPVLLALHGFPGTPMSVVGAIHLADTMDSLVASHAIAPSIIVAPQIDTPRSLDTECINDSVPTGPQTETWLAQDIPAWTMAHFPVQSQRTGWAVLGYSMGGWCSAMVAMRHPDLFGASIAFQGYFRPDFSSYEPMPPGSKAARGYDLVRLARTSPPPLAMWVLTSRPDGLSYPSTSLFLRNVRPPLAVTSVVLQNGGHRASVWIPFVGNALRWLGQTMPGFRPR